MTYRRVILPKLENYLLTLVKKAITVILYYTLTNLFFAFIYIFFKLFYFSLRLLGLNSRSIEVIDVGGIEGKCTQNTIVS